jgi:hypothetical protein
VTDSRVADDYYPTPDWVAQLAPLWPGCDTVCDPCAGAGHLLDALCRQRPALRVYGLELDAGRSAEATLRLGAPIGCADALSGEVAWPSASACVMNPPFSVAARFVERALRTYPVTLCLLPISWLEPCRDRRPLLVTSAGGLVPDVFVLPRRPKFRVDRTGTAAVTVGWFRWLSHEPHGYGHVFYPQES